MSEPEWGGPAGAVGLDDVRAAAARIAGLVQPTPVVAAGAISRVTGADVRLKLEAVQDTGSFKLRGASNLLRALEDAGRTPSGVVTFSTGNHGRAVATVARRLGIPATVCVAEGVPDAKLRAIRETGATLHVEGPTQDHAAVVARRLADEHGLELVPPFDDPAIIAGQGTIGLELVAQLPAVDVVLVPVSGGGLIAGIALAVKALRPDVRVVGVYADHVPAMHESLRAGRPIEVPERPSLADSLAGGIGTDNRHTFGLVREHVDDLVGVDEEQIADGLAYALREERLVLEGAAVVGLSALLHGLVDVAGRTVGVVVTGRNADVGRLLEVVAGRPRPGTTGTA